MEKIRNFLAAFEGKLSVFKKHPPILTAEDFGAFLGNRAAWIAQKTLYGYLKTRMGMQFPKMFDDDRFVESINVAKWNIYAACASDLAIFMAARFHEHSTSKKAAREMAHYWYKWVLRERFENEGFPGSTAPFLKEFEKRLPQVDWSEAAHGEGAFTTSPQALVAWSPIDDSLKQYDEPLVLNSIRFQWQAIRRDFVRLLDHEAVEADWAAYRREALG